MNFLLVTIFALSAGLSVFYSAKTRTYRKQGNYNVMKYYNAKGNISMGSMLISLGCIQMFTFGEDASGTRIIVGVLFLLLGVFNFFMGLRNYRVALPLVKKNIG
jgi:hypothetical protein